MWGSSVNTLSASCGKEQHRLAPLTDGLIHYAEVEHWSFR